MGVQGLESGSEVDRGGRGGENVCGRARGRYIRFSFARGEGSQNSGGGSGWARPHRLREMGGPRASALVWNVREAPVRGFEGSHGRGGGCTGPSRLARTAAGYHQHFALRQKIRRGVAGTWGGTTREIGRDGYRFWAGAREVWGRGQGLEPRPGRFHGTVAPDGGASEAWEKAGRAGVPHLEKVDGCIGSPEKQVQRPRCDFITLARSVGGWEGDPLGREEGPASEPFFNSLVNFREVGGGRVAGRR